MFKAAGTKEEKMIRVAESSLELLHEKGPDGLIYAEVARRSAVSRPWLYKYFGGGHGPLIQFASRHFFKLLADMAPAQPHLSKREWLEKLMRNNDRLLTYSAKYPGAIRAYFYYRGNEGSIGDQIHELETMHAQKEVMEISAIFGFDAKTSREKSEYLGHIRMGLAHGWIYGDLKRMLVAEDVHYQFAQLAATLLNVPADEVPKQQPRLRPGLKKVAPDLTSADTTASASRH
jgi:hypothetical protein